jgi:two-component system sensor histidine kinase DctS
MTEAAAPATRSHRSIKSSIAWALGLLALVAAVAAAGRWAEDREARAQVDALRRTAEIQALNLRAEVTRFEYLPHAIAQHQDVQGVLAAPDDPVARGRANRFLADIAERAKLSALYVMNLQGTTLAASNWDLPDSFVGQSYRERPYFATARTGGTGLFYGIGLTTGVPGFFIAGPVRRAGHDIIGVVSVKVSLSPIEAAWALMPEPILLSDERGIVFLGNVPIWQYHATRALRAADLDELRRNRQYGERSAFDALPWHSERDADDPGRLVRTTLAGQRRSFLAIDTELPELGWTLTVTADGAAMRRARYTAWALSATALTALLMGGAYWRLRERRFAEQRNARNELEQRVRDRTRELEDARGFWQAMEDSLLVGMRARDLSGRIIYVNPALCEMLGYRADELVGCMPPYPYWHPDFIDKHWRDNEAVITGRAALNGFESRVRHRDGHDVHTMVYTAPLIDATGRQSGWMSSVVDITAQRAAEELQRSQQAQLQQANRVLSLGEMATALAHELNQPLMALSNFAAAAQAFARQGPSEMLVASLDDITAQARRAGEIVARIRGFVRQRSGGAESCRLIEIASSVVALVEPERRKRQVRLLNRVAELPAVRGDRVLLEQVILNLVLNAMQAMDELPVAHRIVTIDARAGATSITVSVADRGTGVASEVAEHLFEPFITTKAGGLGLGLSICRTIVEGHGGHLGFESGAKDGAVFFFTLPL